MKEEQEAKARLTRSEKITEQGMGRRGKSIREG